MKVHQIKIDFNVTPEISRFVYVYLIEGESIYMIDSGVAGSEKQIEAYLSSIGRDITDIKAIFLTHAHPDHIGTAAYFKEKAVCKIYASEGECPWIEDIDKQFNERPIPNFYTLVGHSVSVDTIIQDGDSIPLEDGINIKALSTPGHSADEMSYIIGSCVFIGDAIPVKGDIPIYIDVEKAKQSIERIAQLKDVSTFYPAWDKTYNKEMLQQKASEALDIISCIGNAVKNVMESGNTDNIVSNVCTILNSRQLMKNPLFARTIESHIVNSTL